MIEQRLASLAAKMDQFNDKSVASSGNDPARDQKIVELYDLAKSTEPITKILPDMLERMKTLEALHSYGNCFLKIPLKKYFQNLFSFFKLPTLANFSLNWRKLSQLS